MAYSTLDFTGRPPSAPFARAAAAFAAVLAFPPLRPRATAAGFFLATGVEVSNGRTTKRAGVVVRGFLGKALHFGWLVGIQGQSDSGQRGFREHDHGGGVGVRHVSNIPKRLGYVKWAEMGQK